MVLIGVVVIGSAAAFFTLSLTENKINDITEITAYTIKSMSPFCRL
jgi:hypothetical protein